MHIVFLPVWYPNRNDDMEGLFVRKHALAVAARHRVDVLFLKAEPNLKEPQYEYRACENLHEHYIYYPCGKNKIKKILCFLSTFRSGFRKIMKENGKPDLVHAHVLDGISCMALWIKYRYRIPYVVTEHWTRYLRNDFKSGLHRLLAQWTAKNAKRILPVSEDLLEAMRKCGIKGDYQQVSNVVDDFFFQNIKSPSIPSRKTILHICCFSEAAKNNFGLLRTVKKLSQSRSDFKLVMVGDGKDRAATEEYARTLHLSEENVAFIGKLQPPQIKEALDGCSFSVLFSNYENQPVVICESLACGKPVVATRVGGIPELIDNSNGITVPVQDEEALLDALNRMLDSYMDYDPQEISRKAYTRFSFEEVGRQLDGIYRQAVKS